MQVRMIFPDIQVAEFIHEKEKVYRERFMNDPSVKKILAKINSVSEAYFSPVNQGTYLRITEYTHPDLFRILHETCRILDHSPIPEIYITDMINYFALPMIDHIPYLLISNRLLEEYDEDMLYYAFGNAVTMIKAGHVELNNLCARMSVGIMALAPRLLLIQYLHAADATSDRGGLLACQSFATAIRCHMVELGIPARETWQLFKDDDEAILYVKDYLKELNNMRVSHENMLMKAAEKFQNATYTEAPANKMLADMYHWYMDGGYHRILKKYAEGCSKIGGNIY